MRISLLFQQVFIIFIGMPLVFASLFYLSPFIAFEQRADMDLFILYVSTLWLLCAPVLILETYRRSIRNELCDRFIGWMFVSAGTALPTFALAITPMVTQTTFINYCYLASSGFCVGIMGALAWVWVLR